MANTMSLMAWEGKMYIGAAGSGTATTECENVDNIKVPIGARGEVEHHLQKHEGQKTWVPGMVDNSMSFDLSMEYTVTDGARGSMAADVATIVHALQDGNPVCIKLLDSATGAGTIGDYILIGGEVSRSGEEVQKISVTARPYAGGDGVEAI